MEAIVIGLAIPVAIVLEQANHGLAGGIGGALALCAVLIGGVVGRPRMGWALWAGTALQVLVIAAGVVVPAMYVLGVIFAALWITGIWLARRHEPPKPQPSARPRTSPPRPSPRRPPPPRPRPRAAHPRAPHPSRRIHDREQLRRPLICTRTAHDHETGDLGHRAGVPMSTCRHQSA